MRGWASTVGVRKRRNMAHRRLCVTSLFHFSHVHPASRRPTLSAPGGGRSPSLATSANNCSVDGNITCVSDSLDLHRRVFTWRERTWFTGGDLRSEVKPHSWSAPDHSSVCGVAGGQDARSGAANGVDHVSSRQTSNDGEDSKKTSGRRLWAASGGHEDNSRAK